MIESKSISILPANQHNCILKYEYEKMKIHFAEKSSKINIKVIINN